MRIFISMPMRGKSSEQINVEMVEAANRVQELFPNKEVILLQSNILLSEEATDIDYLAESIRIMGQADLVYFMKGWHESRGCRVEELVATQYHKQCYYEV